VDSEENIRVGHKQHWSRKELLKTVKAKKIAYYDHIMKKQGSYLEKVIMHGTMPGARTAWIKTSRRGQDSPRKSQSE